MTISEINSLSNEALTELLSQCCAAQNWVNKMVSGVPYQDADDMKNQAVNYWQQMGEDDWMEAFLAHPMIGDVKSLREKYANTLSMASNEQASTREAADHVLKQLACYNQKYLEKFGFIFIVFASNKTAEQMLDLLLKRIHNSRDVELKNAADEQLKITLLRIEKLFAQPASVANE